MKKKISMMALSLAAALTLTACGGAPEAAPEADPAPDAAPEAQSYTVGICQLVQHPALDAATQGFMDELNEALPGQVEFDLKNASGDIPTCGVISTGFAANQVDLILANATPALQAAASATMDIPILGTAVTEYGVALEIPDFSGTVGGNISGTADLAPLDQQAAMFPELLPQAKTVGILYCSAEPNSVYQAEVVTEHLADLGITAKTFTFADSNDVAAVTATACDECDALYIPTDNTAASCAEAINNVAEPAGVPIIAGESGICAGCGIATLSIDYYELGRTTGKMAVKVLTGEADISTMPIEYFGEPTKKCSPDRAEALGVAIPDDYVPVV